MYDIFCTILYVLREGCRWRALPHDFPKWQNVYYIGVDTSGPLHAMFVITANMQDRDGARCLIGYAYPHLSKVQKVLLDGRYTGNDFAQDVKWLINAQVEVVKRNELLTFEILPKRWIVERSFAWLDKCRRLWKNCERLLHTSLKMANLAFISLLLNRY